MNSSKQCSKKLSAVNLYSLPAGFYCPWVKECTSPKIVVPRGGGGLNALSGKGNMLEGMAEISQKIFLPVFPIPNFGLLAQPYVSDTVRRLLALSLRNRLTRACSAGYSRFTYSNS